MAAAETAAKSLGLMEESNGRINEGSCKRAGCKSKSN